MGFKQKSLKSLLILVEKIMQLDKLFRISKRALKFPVAIKNKGVNYIFEGNIFNS